MINCLIIDDEPIAIRVIKNHLSAFKGFHLVAECSNALEAMPVLSEQKIDLLFCDIQMPRLTGVEFIRSLSHRPKIIFITAFRDYAVEAFELNVIDYLLKPVSFERFTKAIQHFMDVQSLENGASTKLEETDPAQRDFLFLKADKKHHKINLKDIIYIESLGDYIKVFTDKTKIVTKEPISNLAAKLPGDQFLQIHRSYIISVSWIESVGHGFIEITGKKLPVGRSFRKLVKECLLSK